jgi:hypothetical protein
VTISKGLQIQASSQKEKVAQPKQSRAAMAT